MIPSRNRNPTPDPDRGSPKPEPIQEEPIHFGSVNGAAAAIEPEPELKAEAEAVSDSIEERKGAFELDEVADTPVPTIASIETQEIEFSHMSSEAEPGEGLEDGGEPGIEIDEEPGEAPVSGNAATNAPPQSASLREQGGRYMHRMPRRSRRRQRSGAGGPESAPVVANVSDRRASSVFAASGSACGAPGRAAHGTARKSYSVHH